LCKAAVQTQHKVEQSIISGLPTESKGAIAIIVLVAYSAGAHDPHSKLKYPLADIAL
jgi:hypothetical protein